MATFNRFNQFTEDLCKGVHNLPADTLKYMLTNSAPVATNAVAGDITEIAAGNGYAAGGITISGVTTEQASGITPVIVDDEVLTASGGSIGPFRYVVLYNDTPTSPADPLIGWWDRGSELTLADGDSLTLDADPTNGLFRVGATS